MIIVFIKHIFIVYYIIFDSRRNWIRLEIRNSLRFLTNRPRSLLRLLWNVVMIGLPYRCLYECVQSSLKIRSRCTWKVCWKFWENFKEVFFIIYLLIFYDIIDIKALNINCVWRFWISFFMLRCVTLSLYSWN